MSFILFFRKNRYLCIQISRLHIIYIIILYARKGNNYDNNAPYDDGRNGTETF